MSGTSWCVCGRRLAIESPWANIAANIGNENSNAVLGGALRWMPVAGYCSLQTGCLCRFVAGRWSKMRVSNWRGRRQGLVRATAWRTKQVENRPCVYGSGAGSIPCQSHAFVGGVIHFRAPSCYEIRSWRRSCRTRVECQALQGPQIREFHASILYAEADFPEERLRGIRQMFIQIRVTRQVIRRGAEQIPFANSEHTCIMELTSWPRSRTATALVKVVAVAAILPFRRSDRATRYIVMVRGKVFLIISRSIESAGWSLECAESISIFVVHAAPSSIVCFVEMVSIWKSAMAGHPKCRHRNGIDHFVVVTPRPLRSGPWSVASKAPSRARCPVCRGARWCPPCRPTSPVTGRFTVRSRT